MESSGVTIMNRALVCRPSAGKNRLSLEEIALPSLKSSQVLVRVTAAAQNPTDVQCFDSDAFGDGAVLGCDFCGIVEKVGTDVESLVEGDRIAGLVWGGEIPGLGAYSEHTVAEQGVSFMVPETVSAESAATLPLAITTAWLALFSSQCLNINVDNAEENQVLIWGGSSSVGLYAIQIAKIFGLTVATVCTNFDVVKAAGAQHVFDYRSPTVIDDIKKALPKIAYVFDCIGSPTSSIQASRAIREGDGGRLCTVRPGKQFCEGVASTVKVTDVLVWTVFLKEHRYKEFYWPPSEEDHGRALELYRRLPEWLRSGAIVPNKVRVVEGGFAAVSQGFQLYREKAVSGEKIVYQLG